jgi:hypothetical protein
MFKFSEIDDKRLSNVLLNGTTIIKLVKKLVNHIKQFFIKFFFQIRHILNIKVTVRNIIIP